jgi:hypothetical protein
MKRYVPIISDRINRRHRRLGVNEDAMAAVGNQPDNDKSLIH